MKKKQVILIGIATLILVLGTRELYYRYFGDSGRQIHIAAVVPNRESISGISFIRGISLCFDGINKKGGINGKKIDLQIYEDENDPEKAVFVAEKIAAEGRAVAVIGHYYSSSSIAAGSIYKENKIPAISPASTNVRVTLGNEWYFRSTFNDQLQGRFLANYAAKVFGYKRVCIINETFEYGSFIARTFKESCEQLGVDVIFKESFTPGKKDINQRLREIVNNLKKVKDPDLILLSVHAPEGVKLIKLIRDNFIDTPLMAPDSFSSVDFQEGVKQYPKEKRNPGYYTNNIHVINPWNTDTITEKGQKFRDAYFETYDSYPGWHGAFAYDTALVLSEVLKKTMVEGKRKTVEIDRKKIRDGLAAIDNIYNSVNGVTGFNYFDKNGDSQKPIYLGVYNNQKIISALTQFQTIPNPYEIANFDEARKQGRIRIFDGKYSFKINVVYAGIRINEISDLDPEKFSATIDFNLWFRFQKGIDPSNVEFINAEKPFRLENPVLEKVRGDEIYRLYHVKEQFRADFLPEFNVFGSHVVGVAFRHRSLDRNNLVFVKDVLGMRIESGDHFLSQLKQDAALVTPGWRINNAWIFSDFSQKSPLGDPEYFKVRGGLLEYSRFNVGIRLQKDRFTLRRPSHNQIVSLILGGIGFIASFFFWIIVKGRYFRRYLNIVWFFQILAAIVFLIYSECFILDKMVEKQFSGNDLNVVVDIFDILWWLLSAYFVIEGLERFIWTPIEQKTGRSVPHIIRGLISFLIYTLAVFGIVAFVFDQALTSLLATSGVIAMIIGLAIQINISNIFSGIAINVERPFRIGDWVKIGSFTEGKVIDINWRTTRLKTRDDTVLSIPNSKASESSIENFSYPEDGYWKYFTIHVDPSHPPERVKKVLLDAALSSEYVSKDPPPSTRFLGLTAGITGQSESWAANYLISIYVRDYGKKFAHNEAIWQNVWSHLKLAGIKHVMERQEIMMKFQGMVPKRKKMNKAYAILQDIDVFQPFSDKSKAILCKKMRREYFPPGQIVVRQGDEGDSLFIIEEGALAVWTRLEDNRSIEVARLGAGSFFGEMALLTGEPRTATIIAVSDTYLFEITKADIYPLILEQPEIFSPLSEVLSKRKMSTEFQASIKEEEESDELNLATQILGKIQNFFGIK